MGNEPRSRLLHKQLLAKPASERFNLHKRWEEIASVMVSCQRTWEKKPCSGKGFCNVTPSLRTPRLTFPHGFCCREQKDGAKTGKGLSPTRNVCAQRSPAHPHLVPNLDKSLPVTPVRWQKSGLIPTKSMEHPRYQRVESDCSTAASVSIFSAFCIHQCPRRMRRCATGNGAAQTIKAVTLKMGCSDTLTQYRSCKISSISVPSVLRCTHNWIQKKFNCNLVLHHFSFPS